MSSPEPFSSTHTAAAAGGGSYPSGALSNPSSPSAAKRPRSPEVTDTSLKIRHLVAIGMKDPTGTEVALDKFGVKSYEDYRAESEYRVANRRFSCFAPQYTGNHRFQPINLVLADGTQETLDATVQRIYSESVHNGSTTPGAFGDFIKVTLCGNIACITEIAQKSFPKPALASDMVIFIKGVNAEGKDIVFFVGINRKAEPGKDKPATIGGFNNLGTNEGIDCLDSDIYTILEEGLEEGDVQINVDNIEALREDYNAVNVPGMIRIQGENFPIRITKSGEFKTGDAPMLKGGERIHPERAEKRVHKTTAITVSVDLGNRVISQEDVSSWFTAGSDASKIFVTNVTPQVQASFNSEQANRIGVIFHKEQEMGILHHAQVMGAGFETAHKNFFSEAL